MIQTFITDWHAMRWIRLAFAIFSIIQGIVYREPLFGFMAAYFLFQSVFNKGCRLNGCSIPTQKRRTYER